MISIELRLIKYLIYEDNSFSNTREINVSLVYNVLFSMQFGGILCDNFMFLHIIRLYW